MNYTIFATITGRASANLRVEAWDAANILPDLIDVAITDARGRFEMTLDADYLAALLPQKNPSIAFRIFDGGKPAVEAQRVVWNVSQQATQLQIPLVAATTTAPALTPAPSVVRGTICNGDGSPAANRIVRAFDRNLGATGFTDTQLGQATSAADGQYEIRYAMPAGGKLRADLIVRVFTTPTGTNVPSASAALVESRLISNAPTVAMVDLGLGGDVAALPSEHRMLVDTIQPFLDRAKVALADLKPEHFAYFAGASGVQPDRLQMMIDAAHLARDAGGRVDPEVCYALLRTGYQDGLDGLRSAPISVVRARLEQAIDQNQMSPTLAPQLDIITSAIRDAVVARAFPATGTTMTSTALGNSLASSDIHQAFLRRWLDRDGSPEDFWDDVRADAQLGPHADDLETTLRLQILFGGFQPALAELRARRQVGTFRSHRDLARWQDADWQTFLSKTGTPPDTPGDAPAAKATAYARAVGAVARAAYSTEYLRGRAASPIAPLSLQFLPGLAAANPSLDMRRPLPDSPNWGAIAPDDRAAARAEWDAFRREARSFRGAQPREMLGATVAAGGTNPVRAAANRVLLAATDLDLENVTVDQYVASHPTALNSVPPEEQLGVIGYLKGAQRLLRVVRRPEAVDTLLGDGIDSALRIARMPRAQFIERYQTAFGGASATGDAYTAAFRIATTSQLALTTVVQSIAGTSPWAVRGGSTSKFEVPDYAGALNLFQTKANAHGAATWPTLFGDDSWCDCDECRSAWGPAAYFVDLIHMIDPEHRDHTPADRLFARRPDLQYLPLTCENTNTPIPTIDLINEILELYIANDLGITVNTRSYDNTGVSAEVLRAVPLNLIDEVYVSSSGKVSLATEIYPFTLPFHRPLAIVRTYLDQLGTSYREVFDAFGPRTPSQDLSHAEHVAAEDLGLSLRQFQLIGGMASDVTLPAAYGYTGQEEPEWSQQLAAVPELLRRTGITYDDLYALVSTFFISPGDSANRPMLEDPLHCQIDNSLLLRASDDTWDRLHRFIRLWRVTPWSIADLDRVLFAVGDRVGPSNAVTLDHVALNKIGEVKRVVEALQQPLAAVLTLWSDIDTWGSDSLYLQRFANATIAQHQDDPTAFQLEAYDVRHPERKPPAGTDELRRANDKLDDHRPLVLAALGITASELDAIWNHATALGMIAPASDARLTLHNLTVLFRYTVLANGLEVTVPNLISLLTLSGANPFLDPSATLDFIALTGEVAASSVAIPALDYIYRHAIVAGQGPAPSDSVVAAALIKIWSALRAVRQDTAVTDDADGTLLAARLAAIQPPAIVASVLASLDPTLGPADDSSTVHAEREQIVATYLKPTLPDAAEAILGEPDPVRPTPPVDPSQLPAYQLLVADYEVAAAARKRANQNTLLGLLSDWLRDSQSKAAVVSTVADTLGLSDAMTRRLLVDWIPGDAPKSALDTILGLAGGGLTGHYFSAPVFTGTEMIAAPETIATQFTTDSTFQSVRWIGRLLPQADGTQRLILRTQGTVRITVDSQNATFDSSTTVTDHEFDIALKGGQLAQIAIEYEPGTNPGQLELRWYVASAPAPQAIPAEHLFPEDGLTALDGGSGPGYVWRRAHKASLLIAGLGITEAEIDYAQPAAAMPQPIHPFGDDFALGALPMRPPAGDLVQKQFAQWRSLASFIALRKTLPNSETSLVAALTWTDPAARVAEWSRKLCEAGVWDVAVVDSLLDASEFTEADWSQPGTTIVSRLLSGIADVSGTGDRLAALQRCIALIKRVGVSAATLRAWAAQEPDATSANQVIQAVRASYSDNAEWLAVAQSRNDTIRRLQRDALVAHIMPRIQIEGAPPIDVNALFEYFLIDVEMSSCGLTSRVKQAISSVQLFIQRILLNLEGVSPTWIDPAQWEWNKNYRVWQANREIFLYPENWIDPELRVDKTPFFVDLQSQLAQGPLDPSNVEAAFLSYLEKLEDVARLVVCAVHWQRDGSNDPNPVLAAEKTIDTLHIVARTQGSHPMYYYRTLLGVSSGGTEWAPWQKIDLDILGDGGTGDVQMLLLTYNRRLYLFWAQFMEVPEETQPGANQGETPPPPLTHWEIRLEWATYRDGAWSAKQVTSTFLRSNRFVTSDPEDRKGFQSIVKDLLVDYQTAKHIYEQHQHAIEIAETALITKLGGPLLNSFRAALNLFNVYGPGFTEGGIAWVAFTKRVLASDKLGSFEARIANKNQTFEDFLNDLFHTVATWRLNVSLNPAKPVLAEEYALLTAKRKLRDKHKEKYEKLARAVEDFKKGKTDLNASSETRQRDHTLWLSADGTRIELMRHDEAANPFRLGYFELSADGRSVSTTADTQRMDLTRQMPDHSEPAINAFEINTSAATGARGLDLEGLPNLLGKVHAANFFHEHWFNHAVTSESPRPFFLAKGADLNIALPNDGKALEKNSWTTARIADTSLGTNNVTGNGFESAGEMIAAQTAFGIDQIVTNPAEPPRRKPLRFEPFQHPFIGTLITRLEREGVDGLLSIATQTPARADDGGTGGHFDTNFAPSHKYIAAPYARYDVDFRSRGAYALYNWELFFHAPFLIANRLTADARHEDACKWLHYIFDPTTASHNTIPEGFWKLEWFRDHAGGMDADQMMTVLANNAPAESVDEIQAQIDQWRRYPADPHRIAQLRTSAYQKAIVFKYLDNLIAWADSLFAQNTIETINQATQIYVLASHLLGPRPQHVPQKSEAPSFCYDDLRGDLDQMSETIENMLHPAAAKSDVVAGPVAHSLLGISHLPLIFPSQAANLGAPQSPLVFCVPANSKLLGYFDVIDDRLFKIRNCMNIEGVVQQLPLFEPPLDPALLVRAVAMGLDIGSILADLSAPLPFHRFPTMLQKALELCSEVKSLGAELLSALEKRDGETVALLRATHDTSLLRAILDAKKQQVIEAESNREALLKSRDIAQAKHDYYASREFMNALEEAQMTGMATGAELQTLGGELIAHASMAFAAPDAEIGPTGMGVHATARLGGTTEGNMSKAFGEAINVDGQTAHTIAAMVGILGGHTRRQDDWNFQKDLATKELTQIDKQLVGADIKIAIANLELNNQQLQIDNARKIEETLHTKYTNTELYQWMITQVSTTYYQAYKLAYDLAKRAERCYRYELGIASSSFIQFGYWDSLHKGLLAGQQLALDLKRLEGSYLQTDRRYYEITRQISLVLHDPEAFMDLRTQGTCEVDLTEELFDADYPGHYFRRIKSVGLTLPCVVGPYTPINCTLTLLQNHVRISANAGGKYPEQNQPNDARFSHNYGAIQSVATSHGQNDAGMFEVNFRDERYLPFEGAGAISRWRIDLPKDCNALDFDTLSDVVMKLSYTAREGGKPLADAARKSLSARRATTEQPAGATAMTPLRRLFRLRYEFSDSWMQFRNALATRDASLVLTIDGDRFPFLFHGAKITIVGIQFFATLTEVIAQQSLTLRLTPPQGQPQDLTLTSTSVDRTVLLSRLLDPSPQLEVLNNTDWTIAATAGFPIASVRDLALIVTYTVQ